MASILDIKRYCEGKEKCGGCDCKYFCENMIADCSNETIQKVNSTVNDWLKVHPVPSYLDELLRRMPALKGHEEKFINYVCVETMFDVQMKDSKKKCLPENCSYCWRKEYKGEK